MDVYDAAVLSCQLLLVFWTSCLGLLACCNRLRSCGTSISFSTASCCLGSLWRWLCQKSPDDERVAMHMAERRLARMQIAGFAMMIANFASGVLIIFNIVAEKPRTNTAAADIATIAMVLITIVCNVWPGVMARMPNLLYSTWMAWTALKMSPAAGPTDDVYNNVWFAMRMFFSVSILDMRTITLWNAVSGVCIVWTYVVFWLDKQCTAIEVSGPRMAMRELFSFILIVSVCFGFKRGITAEIREKLGANASRRECGAVNSLLGAMSDVVVKLDSTLHVLGDCPKLATLLLKESVRDTKFENLLFAEEDVQEFHDCIARTAEKETDVIAPWLVRLRDGVGTCVTAECFHTELEDVAGRLFHMIGIRELQAEAEAEAAANILAARRQNTADDTADDSLPASNVSEARSVQSTPMPNELFLELILQECNGIAPAEARAAAEKKPREEPKPKTLRLSRSRGSSRSARSRGSSRSSRSSKSSKSSGSVRSCSEPRSGCISSLREAAAVAQTEASCNGGRESSQAEDQTGASRSCGRKSSQAKDILIVL